MSCPQRFRKRLEECGRIDDRGSTETTHAARHIINQIKRRRQRDLGMNVGRLTARSPCRCGLVTTLERVFDKIADINAMHLKFWRRLFSFAQRLALHWNSVESASGASSCT